MMVSTTMWQAKFHNHLEFIESVLLRYSHGPIARLTKRLSPNLKLFLVLIQKKSLFSFYILILEELCEIILNCSLLSIMTFRKGSGSD